MTRVNQFFREVSTALHTPAVRTALKQAGKQVEAQLVRDVKRFADGFSAARPTPSKATTATSNAADTAFVTSLYREVLGRAPDAGGFSAHLTALQNGATREAVRQAFLDSDEFKAKSEVVAPAPAPKTGVEQLKQLIAADLKTAYGREATETDFAYWLPKLQEPCDSGFVTSGQMTGVEYYHRRMLGWQAGGPDLATSGPYAGGPEAHGPVPSAIDVVGGSVEIAPTAPTTPVVTPSTSSTEQLKKLIAADLRLAGGREATERDYAYWLPMLQSPCDSGFVTSGQMTGVEYYHRRMLGWQAGAADLAIAGPYAGSPEARGPVPSAVDLVGPLL